MPEAGKSDKRTFTLAQMRRGGQLHIVEVSDRNILVETALCGLWSEFCAWRATFDETPELLRGGWKCHRCDHIAQLRGIKIGGARLYD
jgi:hypothetical protein